MLEKVKSLVFIWECPNQINAMTTLPHFLSAEVYTKLRIKWRISHVTLCSLFSLGLHFAQRKLACRPNILPWLFCFHDCEHCNWHLNPINCSARILFHTCQLWVLHLSICKSDRLGGFFNRWSLTLSPLHPYCEPVRLSGWPVKSAPAAAAALSDCGPDSSATLHHKERQNK